MAIAPTNQPIIAIRRGNILSQTLKHTLPQPSRQAGRQAYPERLLRRMNSIRLREASRFVEGNPGEQPYKVPTIDAGLMQDEPCAQGKSLTRAEIRREQIYTNSIGEVPVALDMIAPPAHRVPDLLWLAFLALIRGFRPLSVCSAFWSLLLSLLLKRSVGAI